MSVVLEHLQAGVLLLRGDAALEFSSGLFPLTFIRGHGIFPFFFSVRVWFSFLFWSFFFFFFSSHTHCIETFRTRDGIKAIAATYTAGVAMPDL